LTFKPRTSMATVSGRHLMAVAPEAGGALSMEAVQVPVQAKAPRGAK
jgi:hypothetical protein